MGPPQQQQGYGHPGQSPYTSNQHPGYVSSTETSSFSYPSSPHPNPHFPHSLALAPAMQNPGLVSPQSQPAQYSHAMGPQAQSGYHTAVVPAHSSGNSVPPASMQYPQSLPYPTTPQVLQYNPQAQPFGPPRGNPQYQPVTQQVPQQFAYPHVPNPPMASLAYPPSHHIPISTVASPAHPTYTQALYVHPGHLKAPPHGIPQYGQPSHQEVLPTHLLPQQALARAMAPSVYPQNLQVQSHNPAQPPHPTYHQVSPLGIAPSAHVPNQPMQAQPAMTYGQDLTQQQPTGHRGHDGMLPQQGTHSNQPAPQGVTHEAAPPEQGSRQGSTPNPPSMASTSNISKNSRPRTSRHVAESGIEMLTRLTLENIRRKDAENKIADFEE
ncbi:uncharacterized protein ALTATR162_LOCUS2904 [Alternaria atra]|uniref:Uncharacterized protein n=1 Tax=Alternaria atra TaxID=119953 RepID=A0A8J2HZX8_9PLEO|nr:uncharacterized protein ALTATR162_LOCUS2904 [Alternaria atra]CAG5152766.1 unnamed protein product [Alternaria atra]